MPDICRSTIRHSGSPAGQCRKKLMRRSECHCLKCANAQRAAQGFQHGRVVVHNRDPSGVSAMKARSSPPPARTVDLAVGPGPSSARCRYLEILSFSAMRTRSAIVRTPSFSHHRTAVEFDGLLHRPKIVGDLLVEPPGDNVGQHLAFPRRQGRHPRFDLRQFGLNPPKPGILVLGSRYGPQQVRVAHRLGQEIDGACLHGAHARRNVALPGDENDRPTRPSGCQRLLQLKTVEPGHRDIEDRATRNRRDRAAPGTPAKT